MPHDRCLPHCTYFKYESRADFYKGDFCHNLVYKRIFLKNIDIFIRMLYYRRKTTFSGRERKNNMRNLFSTPGRAITSIIVLLIVISVILFCMAAFIRAAALSDSIGKAKAEQIAISDAGVSVSQARFSRTEFTFDDGMFVYKIDFFTDWAECEYVICANDGTILRRNIDATENPGINPTPAPTPPAPAPAQ